MGMLELKKNSFYKIIKEYESIRIVGEQTILLFVSNGIISSMITILDTIL